MRIRVSYPFAGAIALAVLAATTVVTAQQQIAMPAFNRTFSSAALTRGIYFQTPVPITVVGLRVPDESNHGLQNVAVYRMAAKPPTYPTTVSGGLQFYAAGVASSVVIPTAVSYKAGEWVGVLGACGDASIMHNSYSPAGPFQTTVLGQPTTLFRLNSQTNIVSTQGNSTYSEYDIGEMGRVEIYVSGTLLQGSGPGTIGSTMSLGLSAPNDIGLPYVMASSLGTGPTPIDTRALNLTLDSLFAASVGGSLPTVFVNYAGTIGASGGASGALVIPAIPVLKGVIIHSAFVTFQGSAPSGVQSISNTFSFTIG